eukprot:TRINITY_DN21456_c0_g1_i1.p1 TRINITY_DN21456_c0_g1~~TRINITY_DN21456_c0_g1_i1.p1  ORF type:complete len:529 (-),score=108.67 TRINITY_DN21456_c0_g1_i1:119-1705(-)
MVDVALEKAATSEHEGDVIGADLATNAEGVTVGESAVKLGEVASSAGIERGAESATEDVARTVHSIGDKLQCSVNVLAVGMSGIHMLGSSKVADSETKCLEEPLKQAASGCDATQRESEIVALNPRVAEPMKCGSGADTNSGVGSTEVLPLDTHGDHSENVQPEPTETPTRVDITPLNADPTVVATRETGVVQSGKDAQMVPEPMGVLSGDHHAEGFAPTVAEIHEPVDERETLVTSKPTETPCNRVCDVPPTDQPDPDAEPNECLAALTPQSKVKYWSKTMKRWISATVVRRHPDGTFDLDLKRGAKPQFIRPLVVATPSSIPDSGVSRLVGEADHNIAPQAAALNPNEKKGKEEKEVATAVQKKGMKKDKPADEGSFSEEGRKRKHVDGKKKQKDRETVDSDSEDSRKKAKRRKAPRVANDGAERSKKAKKGRGSEHSCEEERKLKKRKYKDSDEEGESDRQTGRKRGCEDESDDRRKKPRRDRKDDYKEAGEEKRRGGKKKKGSGDRVKKRHASTSSSPPRRRRR